MAKVPGQRKGGQIGGAGGHGKNMHSAQKYDMAGGGGGKKGGCAVIAFGTVGAIIAATSGVGYAAWQVIL